MIIGPVPKQGAARITRCPEIYFFACMALFA